jgi:hypothetical protein
MPIHDWTRVRAGTFHHFHQRWFAALGDALVDMPVFLEPDHHVPCPLEATYQTAWSVFPGALKGHLEDLPPAQA